MDFLIKLVLALCSFIYLLYFWAIYIAFSPSIFPDNNSVKIGLRDSNCSKGILYTFVAEDGLIVESPPF